MYILQKFKSVKTSEDMERFLEEFGVQIYEQIVAQVDRLEQDIKVGEDVVIFLPMTFVNVGVQHEPKMTVRDE